MAQGVAITLDGDTDSELGSASVIEVYECIGQATKYRLTYETDISEQDFPFLIDGRINPGSMLGVFVVASDTTHCLVNGPVHAQKIKLKHGGAGSMVEVLGSDTSVTMDRETKTATWADVTDSDAVSQILTLYGYAPDIEPTNAGHFEDKHVLVQRDTDLNFVRRLAKRNGYLFWVTCDDTGAETAHFKRPPLDNAPAVELIINLESPNLDSILISWDVERPTSVIGKQLDLNSKENLDGGVATSPQSQLGALSLAAITMDTRSVHVWAPANDVGNLQARGEGALIESDWFIRANCSTSLHALNDVVRARSVVTLRGAGSRYSGSYFVAAVRHTINATSHKMDVTLVRNGWEV